MTTLHACSLQVSDLVLKSKRPYCVDCEIELWHNLNPNGSEGNEYICICCQRILRKAV